jgi:hypothetical protein
MPFSHLYVQRLVVAGVWRDYDEGWLLYDATRPYFPAWSVIGDGIIFKRKF